MRESAVPRAVVVYSLAQARAALAAAAELGVPVELVSPPAGGDTVGAAWFAALVAQARAAVPQAEATALLDCADAPGRVLAALRCGLARLRFAGPPAVAGKLAAIAEAQGAALVERLPPALDLLDQPDPQAACRVWLARR